METEGDGVDSPFEPEEAGRRRGDIRRLENILKKQGEAGNGVLHDSTNILGPRKSKEVTRRFF